jgi:hypothetical protein
MDERLTPLPCRPIAKHWDAGRWLERCETGFQLIQLVSLRRQRRSEAALV